MSITMQVIKLMTDTSSSIQMQTGTRLAESSNLIEWIWLAIDLGLRFNLKQQLTKA